jgi:hypothetical protein
MFNVHTVNAVKYIIYRLRSAVECNCRKVHCIMINDILPANQSKKFARVVNKVARNQLLHFEELS